MTSAGAAPFCFPIRVRYSEIDSQNIVFNSRYLEYCDTAVTEYFRALGFPPIDLIQRHKCNVVLAHAEIDFLAPGRFDDLLNVFVRVAKLGRTSLTTDIEIRPEGADGPVFRGRLVHVNIDEATGQPVPMPEIVCQAVARAENWS